MLAKPYPFFADHAEWLRPFAVWCAVRPRRMASAVRVRCEYGEVIRAYNFNSCFLTGRVRNVLTGPHFYEYATIVRLVV